jgi:hypothetical protein
MLASRSAGLLATTQALATVALLALAPAVHAQPPQPAAPAVDSTTLRLRTQLERLAADTGRAAALRLSDGSTLVGRIAAVSADSVTVRTTVGETRVALVAVRRVIELATGAVRSDGSYWFPNPNATRLLFAPTAYNLRQGEGYFSDYYIIFPGVAYGVTDRVTIGGGVSLIPGAGSSQLLYVTPKVGLVQGERGALAVGGLFATVPDLFDDGDAASFGILYGVGTLGSRENNVTLGLGFGYQGGRVSGDPVVMLGGQTRVARRLALVSENYFAPGAFDSALLSYGARFLGEQLAFDLGFLNRSSDPIFPGFPYVGVVVNFR